MPIMEQHFCDCVIDDGSGVIATDHATAYRQAHDRMHRHRSQQSAQAEARSIQQKHGSRKGASKRWR
jgi:hypothetical protein